MKKFGFSRSSKSSPAPSDNPYAQPAAAADPYANDNGRSSVSSYGSKAPSYTSRAPSIASQAPSYTSQAPSYTSQPPSGGLPSGPRGGAPPGPRAGGYGGGPAPPAAAQQAGNHGGAGPGYGSDRLGSGGGYGANRYQNDQSFKQNQNAPVTSQPFRAGGYGGLGSGPASRSDSPRDGPGGAGNGPGSLARKSSSSTVNTEVKRGDLFGGAQNRYDPQRGNAYDPSTKPVTGYGQAGASGAGTGSTSGYGEDRELTEEEQEQEKYLDTLAQKKQVKQESAASIQRSLQTMHGIVDVQNETNSRLAYQGESLFNAEKNMDMANNYNVAGLDKAKELQSVNRSMFAMHVSNPFTAKKRAQARDQEVMDRHRAEKGEREETRRNRYAAGQMFDDQNRELTSYQFQQSSYERRAPNKENPYAYEDDSEEEQLENDIDDGLTQLSKGVGMIKLGALQTRDTLNTQNQTIDRIAGKTDRVDDGVRRNRNELDKIR